MFTVGVLRGRSAGRMWPDIIALRARETLQNTNRAQKLQFVCTKLQLVKIVKLITKYREKHSLPIHMFISLRSYFPNFQNVFNSRYICTLNIATPTFGCYPEDRGSRFFRNASTYVPNCNAHIGVVEKQSICVIFFSFTPAADGC